MTLLSTPLRRRLAGLLLALAPWPLLAQVAAPEAAASEPAALPPLTAGVPAAGAITDAPIKGYAVVIGGALKGDNEDVWRRMVELSGGKGSRWVVFGTASQTPDKTARRLADLLEQRGASAEIIPVAPQLKWVDLDKAVRDPALLELVQNANGIFFSGGAQERIIDTFSPGGRTTPMLKAIWDVYRRGEIGRAHV